MMDIFIEMISYPFMVRAIIVGCLVSLCASLLGTSLVLKRYSMIGDGLSHVGFAALAIAYAFHAEPLTISIPACIAADEDFRIFTYGDIRTVIFRRNIIGNRIPSLVHDILGSRISRITAHEDSHPHSCCQRCFHRFS